MLHFTLASLLLFIGYLIGVYASPIATTPAKDDFFFSKDINIAVLFSITMPLLFGLLAALYFQRPNERRTLIKETLTRQIVQIDTNLEKLVEIARANRLLYTQAASVSKQCTLSIEFVFHELKERNITIPDSELQYFQREFHKLRSPLTDIPPREKIGSTEPVKFKQQMEVVDDVCKYSLHRIGIIDAHVADIRRRLLSLVLEVHSSS